jgi:hypothetical protein
MAAAALGLSKPSSEERQRYRKKKKRKRTPDHKRPHSLAIRLTRFLR